LQFGEDMREKISLNKLIISSFIEGAILLIYLLFQRSDPGNGLILGFSLNRILIIAAVFFVETAMIFILYSDRMKQHLVRMNKLVGKTIYVKYLVLLFNLLVIGGSGFLIVHSIQDGGMFRSIMPTVLPVAIWMMLVTVQFGYYFLEKISIVRELNKLGIYVFAILDKLNRFSTLFILIPAIVILGFLIYFLFYGQPNSDEGWYLYASHLVYQGKILYQDFSYTQMPLLPYIYGLPQLFGGSFLLGRITTLFFYVGIIFMSSSMAKKLAGNLGVFLLLSLFATYTTGLFTGVVVKTYTLTAFFMVATLFVLIVPLQNKYKYPIAAFLSICVTLVRLSGFGFSIIMFLYIFFQADKPIRKYVFLMGVLCTTFFLIFFIPDIELPFWNLVKYHVEVNDKQGIALFLDRISNWKATLMFFKYYHSVLLFSIIFLGYVFLRRREEVYAANDFLWFFIGISGFVVLNLIGGRFQTEYFLPALLCLFIFLVSICVGYTRVLETKWGTILSVLLIVYSCFSAYTHEGLDYARFYEKKCNSCNPTQQIHELSQIIRTEVDSDEKVFVLEFLFTVVDANRMTFDDLAMAQFSVTDYSDDKAKQYHLVNDEILKELVMTQSPKALLLSLGERDSLVQDQQVKDFITKKYFLRAQKEYFGQKAGEVYLYIYKE
jgi:hypothetical protein